MRGIQSGDFLNYSQFNDSKYSWGNISNQSIRVSSFGNQRDAEPNSYARKSVPKIIHARNENPNDSRANKKFNLGIGIMPHSDEPLGSVIIPYLDKISSLCNSKITLFENIDPPPSRKYCFNLSGSFFDFFQGFYLPKIARQVEFSYCDNPKTKSELRANSFFKLIKRNKINFLLLVHNDPFSRIAYIYSNKIYRSLEGVVKRFNSFIQCNDHLGRVDFTDKLSNYTYAYFSKKKLINDSINESFGIFFHQKTNIEVITLECPMFDWRTASNKEIEGYRRIFQEAWINGNDLKKRKKFINEYRTELSRINFVKPSDNAFLLYNFTIGIFKMITLFDR